MGRNKGATRGAQNGMNVYNQLEEGKTNNGAKKKGKRASRNQFKPLFLKSKNKLTQRAKTNTKQQQQSKTKGRTKSNHHQNYRTSKKENQSDKDPQKTRK